jgi:tetratricopeptide (TPR) repeat protein
MRALPILAALLVAACGHTARLGTAERELEETRIVASRTEGGELAVTAYTAEELFREANVLVREEHCPDAVGRYDRIADEFPSSRYVSPALYNAGLCLMRAGDFAEAAGRFERLLTEVPGTSDEKHALLELTGLEVEVGRFDDALASADRLLARGDLSEDERLESLARRAQALFGLGRLDDAEAASRSAIAYYRVHREQLPDEFFAACASFVHAEVIRARAEAITLPEADALTQHEYLERRAQLMLDAQRAYDETIRMTEAHWAAASGYRIGSMYEGMFQLIITAPTPPPAHELGPEAMAIYEREFREALAERVRPLVRHAIRYWELTLMMVERTGARTAWADRVRADLEHAREILLGPLVPDLAREASGRELADPHGRLSPEPEPDGTAP